MTDAEVKDMLSKNPSRYFFIKAEECEKSLNFVGAANFYVSAHNAAKRDKHSTAVFYQWNAVRCAEWAEIYRKLQENVYKPVGWGWVDPEENTLTAYWQQAAKVFPGDLYFAAYKKIPQSHMFQAVRHHRSNDDLDFMLTGNMNTDSEPSVGTIMRVAKDGSVKTIPINIDPEVLRHKWAIVPASCLWFDRNVSVRRDIKIEWLKMPAEIKELAKRRKFFDEHITSRLGNNSLGKVLENKYAGKG